MKLMKRRAVILRPTDSEILDWVSKCVVSIETLTKNDWGSDAWNPNDDCVMHYVDENGESNLELGRGKTHGQAFRNAASIAIRKMNKKSKGTL